MQIHDAWLRDLPQEFQDRPKINVFIEAFSRQMEEVLEMFIELYSATDLESAYGQSLDYVGTIIPLSRKEAMAMFHTNQTLDDELYRKFLKFKLQRMTNECTYYDLVESMKNLFGFNVIYYKEPEDSPATIVLEIPDLMMTEENQWIFDYPLIKASGVGLKIKKFDIQKIEMNEYVTMPFYKKNKIFISM